MEPIVSQGGNSIDASNTDTSISISIPISEVYGDPVLDLHLTLWDLFEAAAASTPDADAIVSLWQLHQHLSNDHHQTPNGTNESCLRWSYSELKAKAEQLAESLQKLGCREGMRLAVVLGNCAEWGLFFWAAAKLRMAFVPLDATVPRDAKITMLSVKPHVVVAQDAEGAKALDLSDAQVPVCILCTGEKFDNWMELSHALGATEIGSDPQIKDGIGSTDYNYNYNQDDEAALIIFTSGTTGQPKGCWHTSRNLISQCCDFDPEVNAEGPLRWLIHTPNSHIFAINNALRAWRWSGTAVFPSKSFNVDATLKALVQEQCSIMSATPTLVKVLMAHPSFPSPDQLDLRIVTIGGTSIGADDIRLCREGLGAQMAIQVFGMSEGAPLITWRRADPELVESWHPGVGKVLPGAAARICRPETREILPRSEIGELHIGGTSVITKYFNRGADGSMYSDETGNWLATGDQARIDEKGVVYILGRYKDLIIRGGGNIYPINIERELEQLDGLQVQVVGVPDDLAGQVPVAIVVLPENMTKALVMEKARKADQRYALDSVYTLQELGLEKFPLTSLGKVKKQQLKSRVLEFRQASSAPKVEPVNGASTPPFVDKLLDICEQLIGTRPLVTDSFKYLADSITLLRYCDNVLRVCGQRLFLQDFIENDTVEKQAHLLLSRKLQQARLVITPDIPKFSPPQSKQQAQTPSYAPEPMSTSTSTLSEEKDTFFFSKRAVVRAGFSPSEIEDVLPIRHSLHRTAIGSRPQSYHNRMVFRVCNVAQHQILRALQKALASRPMLRTIVFPASNGVPFHAVLASSSALVEQLVHEVEVDTEDDAWDVFKDDSVQTHSSPLMFHAHVVRTMSDGQLFLSFTFNHSVFDALSITQWYHELDHWIRDINTNIPSLTPYRLFSDLFTQYEDSEPAQKSVAFHVQKLRGISRFGHALWPPQRAPGMMICNDQGSPYAKERRRARDRVWNGEWDSRAHEFQYPRSGRVVTLSGLKRLQDEHNIHPSLFTKSAIALFNVLQTGSSHAFLSVWESARSWPFIPKWMDKLLPPAMSIDGPTVQWILNMFEVTRNETVLEFLQRVVAESEETKQHEHVPWNKVVQNLSDEGPAAVDASFRQAFVWDITLAMSFSSGAQSNFSTLEPIARYDWPDCGFFWNAFMIDSVNLYFIASWDTAQMNDTEVNGHCDSLSDVMRKLEDERNWDKKLSDVFQL
ncbi:hypothetical protein F53441_6728 [Fusarium austroafricanum]|uniref:AMP-dependent synthetase/ligase domain-containing protein n=1 Tax=Fusarium austroafricanum TaxID=2364996 RepID=A0A8H4KIZ1_9HYPO|nr:hypothetical protein F53441_6728 [Fusarium austroafricanum]